MQTRRYPRTMVEAFGPYASGPIAEPDTEITAGEIILIVLSTVASCVAALALLAGLLT